VSNRLQHKVWLQRYGRTYTHFRHADVLFCLDTQDPPPDYDEPALEEAEPPMAWSPRQARIELEQLQDWNAVQPAAVSEEQLDYWDWVLRDHGDVRWTFLCMHMPLWQGPHPAWTRLQRSLGDRPYTTFAGHVHNYRHDLLEGRSHIRLGPTGGQWVVRGPEGNFDHVSQVTVTDQGPVLANILLEGVRDLDGQPLLPVATRSVPIF
jgi:serine/threonine-protein phosphatase CPPED1